LLVQGISLAEGIREVGIQPNFEFANADGTPVETYEDQSSSLPTVK